MFLNEKTFCRCCNTVGIIIIVVCEYLIWIKTQSFSKFLFYSFFANLFGALLGIPVGKISGRLLLNIKIIKKELEAILNDERK